MTKVAGKGAVLKLDLGSGLAAVSQMISIDLPDAENETFDASDLSTGAVKVYQATGYTEPGSMGGEFFFDPSAHETLYDLMATPDTDGIDAQIVLGDSGSAQFDTTVAGIGISGSVVMNDGVKMNLTCKLTTDLTYTP